MTRALGHVVLETNRVNAIVHYAGEGRTVCVCVCMHACVHTCVGGCW